MVKSAGGPTQTVGSRKRTVPPHAKRRTLEIMTAMYCAAKHREAEKGEGGLCASCAETLSYAAGRVQACRFGSAKPVCGRCTVHCYRKDMRANIRLIMRFSGPRMPLRHPLITLSHLFQSLRKTPAPRVL